MYGKRLLLSFGVPVLIFPLPLPNSAKAQWFR